MAGCCSDCSGASDARSVKTLELDIGPENQNRSTTAGETGCCLTGCECDESCFKQLAQVLRASDDDHAGKQDQHIFDDSGSNGDLDIKTESMHAAASESGCSCCDDDAFCDDEKKSGEEKSPVSGVPVVGEVPNKHSSLRKRTVPTQPIQNAESSRDECCKERPASRSRYSDTLAAFGCVCKALLARGLDSCCTTRQGRKGAARPSSRQSIRPLRRDQSPSRSSQCSSLGSCCAKGNCGDPTPSVRSVRNRGHTDGHSLKSTRSRRSVDSYLDECCVGKASGRSIEVVSTKARPSDDPCCGGDCCAGEASGSSPKPKSCASIDSCCRDGCCDDDKDDSSCAVKSVVATEKDDHVVVDMAEKPVDILGQHAVLSIKGMTCTGCENKLSRALNGIPTVHNIKTSLVLCRAEFDFDKSTADLATIAQLIEQRTGFSAKILQAGTTRELLLTVTPALQEKLLNTPLPRGVTEAARSSKDAVRLVYDLNVVGARSVLQQYEAFAPVLAPEPPDPAITAGAKHIRSLALRTALSIVLTIPVLVLSWAPLPPHRRAYDIASLVLATIIQTAITGPFYIGSVKTLVVSRLVETELLIVLSTTTAYVYSVVAFAFDVLGRPLSTGQFFETSTLLVTLIMVGQLVSAIARQRAIEAISLRSLQERKARLVLQEGAEQIIDVRLLQYDDQFLVLPDSTIITDGVVVSGASAVDESMMTGESLPVEKSPGDAVIAGTHNGPSSLVIKVSRLPGENTISDIAGMVDNARLSRAHIQETADWICGWFVPTVLVLATVTFVIWLAVGIAVRKQSSGVAAVTALTYAISVLAVSCPCAIGLAVPMVILIAGGVGAQLGLVFKAATTIEQAHKINHVVLDKTGTVTQGRLSIVSRFIDESVGLDIPAVLSALVSSSRHPVARAVAADLANGQGSNTEKSEVEDVELVTGKGVQGVLRGQTLRGGSASWLGLEMDPNIQPLLTQGLTTFCVVHGDRLLAAFGLSDALRPEVRSVIDAFAARNIRVSILSGDHPKAVHAVAASLGIPTERVRAGCLPVDKQVYIKELTAQGESVLFCGDGTNDAVALAEATVGVHLHTGEGAGVAASAAADVVLTHPSLSGLLTLLALSDAVARRITLNFVWAGVYNLFAVLLAAGAFVNARIPPAYAGLGELVSVLPVVFVAMQLKWFKA
ncbi:heavy metal translocatin [Trametes meyenii]|nr:heavy metal translocatin [Trametes meyenii]